MNNFGGTLEGSFHHLLRKYITIVNSSTSTVPSIIGFTLAIMMLNKNSKVHGHDCAVFQVSEKFHANCSFRNLSDVPQDLDEKIQDLDLSYNWILTLHEDTFQRYKHLKNLTFNHNAYSEPYTAENKSNAVVYSLKCFSNILSLVELDISYTYFGEDLSFRWPTTLQVLKVENGFHQALNLSTLQDLKKLYASSNLLENFPIINILSPLTHLDLTDNKIPIIEPEWISPFCLLTHFGFDTTHEYHKEENYCNCERLKRWMLKFLIEGPHKFHCTRPSRLKCDPNITPLMWIEHNKCVGRHPKGYMKTIVILFSIFTLIILLIFMIIFITKARGLVDHEEDFIEGRFLDGAKIPPITHRSKYSSTEPPKRVDSEIFKEKKKTLKQTKSAQKQSNQEELKKKESKIEKDSHNVEEKEEEEEEEEDEENGNVAAEEEAAIEEEEAVEKEKE